MWITAGISVSLIGVLGGREGSERMPCLMMGVSSAMRSVEGILVHPMSVDFFGDI